MWISVRILNCEIHKNVTSYPTITPNSLTLSHNPPDIDLVTQVRPHNMDKWHTQSGAEEDHIIHLIERGIMGLSDSVDSRNFKRTFKLPSYTACAYDPAWWRYRGVRMNFAVLEQKYLVCYKCNKLIHHTQLQDLTRHL